jgi:hypothetical protein
MMNTFSPSLLPFAYRITDGRGDHVKKSKVAIAGFGKAERENTQIQLDNPLSTTYQYLKENK